MEAVVREELGRSIIFSANEIGSFEELLDLFLEVSGDSVPEEVESFDELLEVFVHSMGNTIYVQDGGVLGGK